LREEVRLCVLHLVLGFFILSIMLLRVVVGRRCVELSG
jgi:cytochrome b561